MLRGGYAVSSWVGRFGFTGGTLSTQFPVIYNVQNGVQNDSIVDGTFGSLPPISFFSIPSNGRISPAPNQGFFVIPAHNPLPTIQTYNLTLAATVKRRDDVGCGLRGKPGKATAE